MTSFKHLQQKLARFDDLRTQQSEQRNRQALLAFPPKRAVPDWLQASLESQGLVFDAGGQVDLLTGPTCRAATRPQGTMD